MKLVRTLDAFYRHNDIDLEKILKSKFSNFLKKIPLEDLKSYVYLHFLKKSHIENYGPLRIDVDPDQGIWHVKKADAKLSTYLFVIIKNYLIAYHSKRLPDNEHLSFEDYRDDNYCKNDAVRVKKINIKEFNVDNLDIRCDLKNLLNELEKKTKHKGNLVCDNPLELSVAKTIDTFGPEGCPEKNLLKAVFNYEVSEENKTGLEKLLISRGIETIEKKKIIKSTVNSEGEKLYYLDQAERRSLYKLFGYYLQGLKDKEISQKFKITVAGIGAMKRNLRKELKHLLGD